MVILGHVIRADGLGNLAITDRIAGSRRRERLRMMYLDRMNEYIGGGVTAQQLLVRKRNREQCRSISGNVCNGTPHRGLVR